MSMAQQGERSGGDKMRKTVAHFTVPMTKESNEIMRKTVALFTAPLND